MCVCVCVCARALDTHYFWDLPRKHWPGGGGEIFCLLVILFVSCGGRLPSALGLSGVPDRAPGNVELKADLLACLVCLLPCQLSVNAAMSHVKLLWQVRSGHLKLTGHGVLLRKQVGFGFVCVCDSVCVSDSVCFNELSIWGQRADSGQYNYFNFRKSYATASWSTFSGDGWGGGGGDPIKEAGWVWVRVCVCDSDSVCFNELSIWGQRADSGQNNYFNFRKNHASSSWSTFSGGEPHQCGSRQIQRLLCARPQTSYQVSKQLSLPKLGRNGAQSRKITRDDLTQIWGSRIAQWCKRRTRSWSKSIRFESPAGEFSVLWGQLSVLAASVHSTPCYRSST